MLAARVSLVLLVGAGCFADGGARRDVARLTRQLEELRRQTDGDRHAAHELENRIFILEDRLETAQVAQGKTAAVPHLPVVTKDPVPDSAPAPADDPVPDPPRADEIDMDRPPLVIRMDGRQARVQDRRARPAAERLPSEPADLAAIDEKLPVVPLPPRVAHATATAAPPASGTDAMTAYQSAYQALGRHEHAVAIAGFRAFLARWPAHDYADNAQYWLGEAYYDQADFRTALVEFRAVLKRYPAGNKAPDALLKVGYCLAKLGDDAGANDVLVQVAQIYPRADAARLAERRLEEMRRMSR